MPLKVYYLDDEELLCENFSDCFESKEIIITTFTNPKEAIESINKNPPDLFFVDFRLPGMTGDEVAKEIVSKIPIFLITGEIFLKTDYNFNQVFFKPYDENMISEVIAGYLAVKKLA